MGTKEKRTSRFCLQQNRSHYSSKGRGFQGKKDENQKLFFEKRQFFSKLFSLMKIFDMSVKIDKPFLLWQNGEKDPEREEKS